MAVVPALPVIARPSRIARIDEIETHRGYRLVPICLGEEMNGKRVRAVNHQSGSPIRTGLFVSASREAG